MDDANYYMKWRNAHGSLTIDCPHARDEDLFHSNHILHNLTAIFKSGHQNNPSSSTPILHAKIHIRSQKCGARLVVLHIQTHTR